MFKRHQGACHSFVVDQRLSRHEIFKRTNPVILYHLIELSSVVSLERVEADEGLRLWGTIKNYVM